MLQMGCVCLSGREGCLMTMGDCRRVYEQYRGVVFISLLGYLGRAGYEHYTEGLG